MSEKILNGYTLIHEHATIDLSGLKNDQDACINDIEATTKEWQKLYEYGVRNVLDVTNIGMGRSVKYIQKLEAQTGINIIMSTGYYKDPFYPEEVFTKSVSELADIMISDCLSGIDNTLVKAQCIGEIGTSNNTMTALEKKVFDASIIAAKKCNVIIATHTTLGTYALEQAKYLINAGISPQKILIGHMDLAGDIEYIKSVLDTGVFIAFDTIGKNKYFPDEKRADFLIELERAGYLKQVMLSLDITRKSHYKSNGGIGYSHLFEIFLPMLRAKGLNEEAINQMLIANPQRLLHR